MNGKFGTSPEHAINFDETVALPYNSLDDRQPETGSLSLFFGAKERFEETSFCRFVHSSAGIPCQKRHVQPWRNLVLRRLEFFNLTGPSLEAQCAAVGHRITSIY